ncbi:hypothetical protein [Nocardia salmonicida]
MLGRAGRQRETYDDSLGKRDEIVSLAEAMERDRYCRTVKATATL